MGDKRQRELFRMSQYATAHPGLSTGAAESTKPRPQADQDRVGVHFDIDAFYAQCEELRDPTLA